MLGTKGETKVMRHFIVSVVVALTFAFSASTASAFATTMTYEGPANIDIGDTVTFTVDFDTEGAADITLLSVSVLFDDQLVAFDGGTSPSYGLYVSGGKGNVYLVPAETNLTLRAGQSDQLLLDWLSNALPGGNRDPGAFQMAEITFEAIGNGLAVFELSNNSPGNVLQLADGSNPENLLSGDFEVQIPEPTAASLSIFALLSLAGLKLRARRQ